MASALFDNNGGEDPGHLHGFPIHMTATIPIKVKACRTTDYVESLDPGEHHLGISTASLDPETCFEGCGLFK